VNLIGEHIDYSLYPVLPMAVTADVLLAVATHPVQPGSPSKISIRNTEARFGAREFEIPVDGEIEIDAETHEWSSYFKAGLRGVFPILKKKNNEFQAVGMNILVDGTVPAGGGLSSSAAFVCASALAALIANGDTHVDKKELCELSIVSERLVGVNSGGMDQSASVFSLRGSATYVSFLPELSATPVEFPTTDQELTFVVAQSFIAADKHTTAPVYYNLRVVECSLAAAFLAAIFGLKKPLPKDSSPLGISLRGFHDSYFEQKAGIADNSKASPADFQSQLETLVALIDDYVTQEEGYTREQVAGLLDVTVDELNQQYMSRYPVRAERFMLRQRALHVFNEAMRVGKFKALLASPPTDGPGDALLKGLGALMNETQDSCRDLYDCSCPELDELCSLARGAGAYGSRLTGAGWGGCSVHLVSRDKVEKVKRVWEEKYYRKRWPDISEERLAEAVVVSKPGSGSFVFRVTGDHVV
jgi:galactokinase